MCDGIFGLMELFGIDKFGLSWRVFDVELARRALLVDLFCGGGIIEFWIAATSLDCCSEGILSSIYLADSDWIANFSQSS